MKYYRILLPMILLVILFNLTVAQTKEEITTQIPELKAFHEVIFKLWHEAWPEKNLTLMKELIPGIDSHLVKIQNVELPGILRDKKAKWNEGVQSLSEIVAEYKRTTATTDTQAVLDAGEKLHGAYEKLVRTIRPVLKEIDEFHRVLYPLYHYYMPDYNREKINSAVLELQAKMDSLNTVELPERLAAKGKSFHIKRKDLDKSVKFLVKIATTINDEETMTNAIKDMHAKYQALEKIFD